MMPLAGKWARVLFGGSAVASSLYGTSRAVHAADSNGTVAWGPGPTYAERVFPLAPVCHPAAGRNDSGCAQGASASAKRSGITLALNTSRTASQVQRRLLTQPRDRSS